MILVGGHRRREELYRLSAGPSASRKGYRAGHRRASRLFRELTLARADGTYVRLLAELARPDVLLIDELRGFMRLHATTTIPSSSNLTIV
jgi:hypothetical protein